MFERKLFYIPYKPTIKNFARQNRYNPTVAEYYLWQKLLSKRQCQGYRFLRQKPLAAYIADFYCAELLMVVEVDGRIHERQQERDQIRTEYLDSLNIVVVRYSNEDVLLDLQGVRTDLIHRVEERVVQLSGEINQTPPTLPLSREG